MCVFILQLNYHACSSNILFEKHDDEHNEISGRLQHCIEMAFDVWSTIKHLHQNVCTQKNVWSFSHVVHGTCKYNVGFTIHSGRNNFNQLWRRIQSNSSFNHPVNTINHFFLARKSVFFLNRQPITLQTDWLETHFHCIRSTDSCCLTANEHLDKAFPLEFSIARKIPLHSSLPLLFQLSWRTCAETNSCYAG